MRQCNRDGKAATCLLFYKPGDLIRQSSMAVSNQLHAAVEGVYDLVPPPPLYILHSKYFNPTPYTTTHKTALNPIPRLSLLTPSPPSLVTLSFLCGCR